MKNIFPQMSAVITIYQYDSDEFLFFFSAVLGVTFLWFDFIFLLSIFVIVDGEKGEAFGVYRKVSWEVVFS